MFDENTDKTVTPEADVQPAEITEADATPAATASALPAASAKKYYANKVARLMNGVFIVSLILMIASLCFQFGFSIFSYVQQGAPSGIAIMYTIVGMGTPLALCLVPFVFKFFAELLELTGKN